MEIVAKLKYLRMSPRKVRLVSDAVRGRSVESAKRYLDFSTKRAGGPIAKLLDSAVANAKNNFSKEGGLFIKRILVDQGPTYKRFRPRARGMVSPINKKTSHVTIVLDGRNSIPNQGINQEQNKS
jgi:large subunit ribosomal protein L22